MRPPHAYLRRVLTAATVLGVAAALAVSPAYAAPAGAPAPGGPGHDTPGMMPAGAPDARTFTVASPRTGVSPATVAPYLLGTDVSSYQHPHNAPISWPTVAAAGESFTVIKATEATNYVNPFLVTDVTGARAAGLLVGVYHYAHPELSATAQADYFSRQINGLGGTMLPPVLDLEATGGLSSSALISWTSAFLTRVRADTGRIPMIYSGPYFWSTAMAGSAAFGQYPLWEAHYTTAAAPQSVNGWPTWTLWQYTDGTFGAPAAVPGIPAHVDRDRFAGSKAQLTGLASSSRPGIQAPFTGTATSAQFPDATFVQVTGDSRVYEIAGLAPLWVTSWAHVGGPHPVRTISLASFRTLRSSPAEGTFLQDSVDGHAYRVTGGAPVVVTSWASFGGPVHAAVVDDWDIAHAGACNGYCHLASTVRDGTIVRSVETGQVYVVAGGAPIYISSWSTYGGVQPYINVNQTAIERAGTGTFWNHLGFRPSDGTAISDGTTGQLYVVTGGYPQVAAAGSVGAMAFTLVDHAAIANAGGPSVWAHLL